ncbi:AAA family ATPase [Leadbettera azotonutricia]|nr:AAA family ATPase [Leadbettera azotonutricia]
MNINEAFADIEKRMNGVEELMKYCRKSGGKELDLSGKDLEEIPPALADLKGLVVLDLSNNKLKELPDFMGSLATLAYLNLSHNRLCTLPESMESLDDLETLNLSHNRFKELPKFIGVLPALETLNIDDNNLEGVPEFLDDLNVGKELNLLDHIEKIINLSKKNGLSRIFYRIADSHIKFVAEKLGITPLQAVLFSHFIDNCEDNNILISQIGKAIDVSNTKILQYMNELEVLEKKKLIRCKKGDSITYRVPREVLTAFRKDTEFKPANHANIHIEEFFTVVEDLFVQRNNDELTLENLDEELNLLLEENMQLVFSQKIKNADFNTMDRVLLICFCHHFVNNNDDNIREHDFGFVYSDDRYFLSEIKRALKNGNHILMEAGLIENAVSDGFAESDAYKLTDKAKKEYLGELNIKSNLNKNKKNLLLSDTLAEKKLFYNDKATQSIEQLASLLEEENFKTVQKRLEDQGMRKGFTCLFYGPPGTGKTETVYQIARRTHRDIMAVDIAETKSCWFGESEKKIKEIFTGYKALAENAETTPILLFNEADAVISKRMELGKNSGSVAQTENAIQNIILQELENLDGILIATTNLTGNMDKAFERRFLYKIEFEKPDNNARQAIWKAIIPELSDADAMELATRHDFSGGQIENIARKRIVSSIITGTAPTLDSLISFCQDEIVSNEKEKKIGFSV